MSNRNKIKKVPSYKQVFDTCNEIQKKAVFFLAGCVDERKDKIEDLEKFVQERKGMDFMTIGDVLATMSKEQLTAVDFILRACVNEHNRLLAEDDNGIHET